MGRVRDFRGLKILLCGISFLTLLSTFGCGGGGGNSGTTTGSNSNTGSTSSGDFALTISPTSISAYPASTVTTTLTYSAQGGFSGTVTLQSASLPSGVSLAPAPPFTIDPKGTALSITSNSSVSSNFTIGLAAVSGNLSHSANLGVQITPVTGTRTDLVSTGDYIQSAVFEPNARVVYVTNPSRNRVDIIDPAQKKITKSFFFSIPMGLDISPDGKTIVVGSMQSNLLFIDTWTQEVKRVAQTIRFSNGDPLPVRIEQPVFANNGDVYGIDGAIFSASALAHWSAETGDVSYINMATKPDLLRRSSDGTQIVMRGNGPISVFDVATQQIIATYGKYSSFLASDPGRNRYAVTDGSSIIILDSSLATTATVPLKGVNFFGAVCSGLFSLDGNSFFYTRNNAIYTVDLKTNTTSSPAPRFPDNVSYADPNQCDYRTRPMAVSDTNLIFSSGYPGVALEDPLNQHEFTVGESYMNLFLDRNTGPLVGGNEVVLSTGAYPANNDLNQLNFWFGELPVPFKTDSVYTVRFHATAPNLGRNALINVKAILPNGQFAFLPESYSYGLKLRDVEPKSGPANASTPIVITGTGFGTDASAIQVAIGGKTATVNSVQYIANGATGYRQYLLATLPTGAPGSGPFDITVTAPSGSDMLKAAFSYEPEVTSYTLPDTILDMVFDARRKNIYFSTRDHVGGFSLTNRQFLAPIPLPTVSGIKDGLGIGILPDGSRLLVANNYDQSIAVIDPDGNSPSKAIPVVDATRLGVPATVAATIGPYQVVGTTDGKATTIVTDNIAHSVRYSNVIQFDPVTGVIDPPRSDLFGNIIGSQLEVNSKGDKVLIFNAGVKPYTPSILLDIPSGKFAAQWVSQELVYNGAISADGQTVTVGHGVLDSRLFDVNTVAPAVNFNVPENYGNQLNDTGSLLYIPGVDAIEIFDVHNGTLIRQIGLPDEVSQTARHALLMDDSGEFLIAATSKGLTVVRHKIPVTVRSVVPEINLAPAGTEITVSGSGFQVGANVLIRGNSIPASVFGNGQLKFTLPSAVTTRQLVVQNPDGTTAKY